MKSVVMYALTLSLSLPLLVACSKSAPPEPDVIRPVKAIQVGKDTGMHGRNFPGRARATQEVNLAFDVAGTLIERPVNIGDEVKTGDLIARLNPKDFQANVKSSQARLRTSKRNFDRAKELLTKKFISQAEYDRLESRVDIDESDLAVAQKALADSVILAPFDGRISRLDVENYEAVQAKYVVARLLDSTKIEMVINLPENLITQVNSVEEIKVTFDSYPDNEFVATIKEVSNEASSTTRTYPVTLILPQPEDVDILPGMAGKAWATKRDLGEGGPNDLMVPVAAVFTPETEAQSYVWVIDQSSGLVSMAAIDTGRITIRGIEVTGGLTVGQWIATAGVRSLKEGQQVSILAVEE
jgi:RND family efflux transporter MFP subunit